MYNGIGLQTARGSGTNGYVQRNLCFVRKTKEKIDDFKPKEDSAVRPFDVQLLEHERRRQAEVRCMELRDLLEEKGMSEDEIEEKVNAFRSKLMAEKKRLGLIDSQGRPIIKDSHELSVAQEAKNDKAKEAFGISNDFVPGSSLKGAANKEKMEAKEGETESVSRQGEKGEDDEVISPLNQETKSRKRKKSKKSKRSSSSSSSSEDEERHRKRKKKEKKKKSKRSHHHKSKSKTEASKQARKVLESVAHSSIPKDEDVCVTSSDPIFEDSVKIELNAEDSSSISSTVKEEAKKNNIECEELQKDQSTQRTTSTAKNDEASPPCQSSCDHSLSQNRTGDEGGPEIIEECHHSEVEDEEPEEHSSCIKSNDVKALNNNSTPCENDDDDEAETKSLSFDCSKKYSIAIFDVTEDGKCTPVIQAHSGASEDTKSAFKIFTKSCMPLLSRGIKFSSNRNKNKTNSLSRSRSRSASQSSECSDDSIHSKQERSSLKSSSFRRSSSSSSSCLSTSKKVHRSNRTYSSDSCSSDESYNGSRRRANGSLSGRSRSNSYDRESSDYSSSSSSYYHSSSRSRSRSSSGSRSNRSFSTASSSSSSSRSSLSPDGKKDSMSRRSRSPSIPRRRGSPSFLERRRITSARKRPIPYKRKRGDEWDVSSCSD